MTVEKVGREHEGFPWERGCVDHRICYFARSFLVVVTEGKVKRIVKRTKEFNGIREACRGQGSMPEIRSTAIVPRFRGNKTISASVFSLPFSPFPSSSLLNLSNNPVLGKDWGTSSGTRERNHEFLSLLPSSYYFKIFKISSFFYHLYV